MIFSRISFVVSALVLSASVAAAPQKPAEPVSPNRDAPSMRVLIVRGAYEGCEPQCEEWISAEGKIDTQTLGRFKTALKAVGSRKLPVFIHSGGGDVAQALEIGRLIRAKGLDVAVTRTRLSTSVDALDPEPRRSAPRARERAKTPPPPPARGSAQSRQAVCASACTLILAAGTHRYVGRGALVGVHDIIVPEQTMTQKVRYYQIRTLRKANRIVSSEKILVEEKNVPRHIPRSKPSADAYRRVRDYLVQMGSSQDVVDLMKTAPPEGIRWLTKAELASTRLSNDERGGETLVAFAPPAPSPPPQQPLQPTALLGGPIVAQTPRVEPQTAAPMGEAPDMHVDRDTILLVVIVSLTISWLVGSLIARLIGASRKPETRPFLRPNEPE